MFEVVLVRVVPTFAQPYSTSQTAPNLSSFLYRLSRGLRKDEGVLPRASFHGKSCEGELHQRSTSTRMGCLYNLVSGGRSPK